MMISLLVTLIQQAGDFSTSSEGRPYAPPEGPLYYLVLIASSFVVLGVVIFMIKWFIWPGEQSEEHIKRKILEEESQ